MTRGDQSVAGVSKAANGRRIARDSSGNRGFFVVFCLTTGRAGRHRSRPRPRRSARPGPPGRSPGTARCRTKRDDQHRLACHDIISLVALPGRTAEALPQPRRRWEHTGQRQCRTRRIWDRGGTRLQEILGDKPSGSSISSSTSTSSTSTSTSGSTSKTTTTSGSTSSRWSSSSNPLHRQQNPTHAPGAPACSGLRMQTDKTGGAGKARQGVVLTGPAPPGRCSARGSTGWRSRRRSGSPARTPEPPSQHARSHKNTLCMLVRGFGGALPPAAAQCPRPPPPRPAGPRAGRSSPRPPPPGRSHRGRPPSRAWRSSRCLQRAAGTVNAISVPGLWIRLRPRSRCLQSRIDL